MLQLPDLAGVPNRKGIGLTGLQDFYSPLFREQRREHIWVDTTVNQVDLLWIVRQNKEYFRDPKDSLWTCIKSNIQIPSDTRRQTDRDRDR